MKEKFALKDFVKKHSSIAILLAIVIVAVLPLIFKTSQTRILCRILMYVTLAGSLNLINGYSGQTCLGQAGFFAVGAYTTAILITRFHISFWPLLLLSGIMAALIGVLIALPILRMKGIYLSMVTLGASEIIRTIALNWQSVTGGAFGIKNITRPQIFGLTIDTPQKFAWLFLIVACIFLFVSKRVLSSRIGRAWMAIREGELAAASLGVEVAKYKILNFAYGAFWAGIAGSIYAPYLRYIDSSAFTLDEGFNILSMIVIGGQGTLAGPIVGAVVVNLLTEALRAISNWRYVVYAGLLIFMMWKRPRGLVGENSQVTMVTGEKSIKKNRRKGAVK
ncbi:MAG: branched-chain amino acid ABC transporter permease [Eubacteriales bacterium]|nr:branched-chain amino acid ABC transporter permease [Eubacteriales bacterium]